MQNYAVKSVIIYDIRKCRKRLYTAYKVCHKYIKNDILRHTKLCHEKCDDL